MKAHSYRIDEGEGDTMQSLELTEVSAGYGRNEVIHGISLSIIEPSIYVVLGPNGAGKTTLFRTIGGILKPSSGQVKLDDVDLFYSKEARKRITYLSHLNALPEEMTVFNALKYYADIEGGDAEHVLDLLNLRDLKDKKYTSLSQGQKKRVSIGKIFLRDRDLYLLDEPTSNVDPKISKEIRDILIKLSKEKFVLYSSHNLYEAREIGTYLILIKNGELKFFDKIENVKTKQYRVGVKSLNDISKLLPESKLDNGYYVVTVDSPKMVAKIINDLVQAGAELVEVRELDNPLQEFFEE
jgi:ABC-2 type transport system ATP-binding protein